MFILRFLVYGLLVKTTLSLRIDEGCEAKTSWRDELNWPEIRIGAWFHSNSNSVLEIQTEIANKEVELYHDKINISRDHYDYIRTRHLKPTSETGNVTVEMNNGWVEFIFTVGTTFNLWYVGTNTTSSLLELDVEMEPKALLIKGSNVTLNCPSKLREWKVTKKEMFIPLDNSEKHQLSFYSKYEMQPTITIGGVEIPLRWNGQALATFSNLGALPPHQLHNITIECKLMESKCKIYDSRDKLLAEVSERPENIVVKGESDSSFYVLLHRNDPYLTQSNIFTTAQSTEKGKGTLVFLIVLLMVIMIAAVLVFVAFTRIKKVKENGRNLELGVNEPLLGDYADSGNSEHATQQIKVLLAVKENKVQEVETLLQNSRVDDIKKACVVAHLLCRKDIINLDCMKCSEREALIRSVQNKYNRQVVHVFDAASKGYGHRVTALLTDYELPHTIRDTKGRSILHIIASASECEVPLWDPKQIKDFLQRKSCYANAVDFDGQTCLHYLANAASNSNSIITWDNKSLPVKNAWLEIANILFSYGCDPTIQDEGDQLPHELARGKRNLELSEILTKQFFVLDGANKKTTTSLGTQPVRNMQVNEILAMNFLDEDEKILKKLEAGINHEKSNKNATGKTAHGSKVHHTNKTTKDNTAYGAKSQQPDKTAKVKIAHGAQSSASAKEKSSFVILVNEVKKGNTKSVMGLMKRDQQLLPLNATNNPLTESIIRGHLEISMLLLSGGAQVCGRSISSFTPLEAAHGVKSLPAIFPAIMRQECINRLEHEIKKIGQDTNYDKVKQHINLLLLQIKTGVISSMNMGDESKSDDENSEQARELLCKAAQRGLPLTCQMFGLLNVNLQSYPSEEKPLVKAHSHGKEGIIYILSRDLKMSVFSHIDINKLPEAFLNELWDDEVKQLERIFTRRRKSEESEKWISKFNQARAGKMIDRVDDEILTYIAQNGLIYILHAIKENVKIFDINSVIDETTGCTILHIAAMYGRLSMIEYLLYDKTTTVLARSKGGFTPAHLAAIRGYKDCVNYLQYYMKMDHGNIDDKCEGGITPSELLHGYKLQAKAFNDFFIPDKIGLEVCITPNAKEKLSYFLEQKFSSHKILNNASLRDFTKRFVSERNSTNDESGFIQKEIREEVRYLLDQVSNHDKNLKGSIVAYRTFADYLRIPIDTVEVLWELTSIQSENSDEAKTNFHDSFYESVKHILKCLTFKSSEVWFSYPTIKKNYVGVTLFLAFHETKSKRTALIKVYLIPVMKTDIQKDKDKFSHSAIKECANTSSLAYMAYADERNVKQVFVASKMEDEIIKRLTKEQRLVYHGCMLLSKMLHSCWWFPRAESRRHSRTWKIYALKITTLPPRVLTSLFLEEVGNTSEEDWTAEKFLDHIIAIFKKAVKLDQTGKMVARKNIPMYLDSRQSTFDAGNLVCSIVEVLETLKQ